MRGMAAVVAFVVVGTVLSYGWGAQAGRIDTIQPAAARVGEVVTISGIGFGGPNLQITVGGVATKLVSATGSKATFIVPAGLEPGPTTVDATQPGAHVGSIGFKFLEGTLLPGAPNARALDAIVDKTSPGVGGDDLLNEVILTRLEMLLTPGATVGQLNAALVQFEAGIISSSKGFSELTIAVPKQASAAALDAIAAALDAQPGVRHAGRTTVAQTKFIFNDPTFDNVVQIRHLLPGRFPAAWNVSGRLMASADPSGLCAVPPVQVVVADEFDSTVPAVFNSSVPLFKPAAPAAAGAISGSDGAHGYLVGLTLGGTGLGANPIGGCTAMTLAQIGGFGIYQGTDSIVANMPSTGKFIVNYSAGFVDSCASDAACQPASDRMPSAVSRAYEGLYWKKKTQSRWQDFLMVVAAGNERSQESTAIYAGMGDARYGSQMEIAQVSDPLMSWVGDSTLWDPPPSFAAQGFTSLAGDATAQASLAQAISDAGLAGPDAIADNVIVVGSATAAPRNTVLTQRVAEEQLGESAFSDRNPDVLAVGESVFDQGAVSGTSFSAPQVAGLASYLWLLDPNLESKPPSATKQAIVANARNKVIDAYATVLSLDAAAIPDAGNAPIRHALLDVNDDGTFNQVDIEAFLRHLYFVDPGTQTITFAAPSNTNADFSIFDLNGDGFTTSGSRRERFDLDRVGSTQYGAANYSTVTQSIEGTDIRFDETALTDVEILCYYAYSPLYQGDPDARKSLLAGRCGLAVDPPQVTLKPGDTQQFKVNAPAAQAVTWTATCGTIDPTTGAYTAPQQGGSCTVRAASTADPSQFAEATVTVTGFSGTIPAEVGFSARISALTTTNTLLNTGVTASNSDLRGSTQPPIEASVKNVPFQPTGAAPATYSMSAKADGPQLILDGAPASGTYTGAVTCDGRGSAVDNGDGSFTNPVIPELRPSVSGVFAFSVPAGQTVTLSLSGQLVHSFSPGIFSNSANVFVQIRSAGQPQPGIVFNSNDFDSSQTTIPFHKEFQIVGPGSGDFSWSTSMVCRGAVIDHVMNVNGSGGVSVSYSIQ